MRNKAIQFIKISFECLKKLKEKNYSNQISNRGTFSDRKDNHGKKKMNKENWWISWLYNLDWFWEKEKSGWNLVRVVVGISVTFISRSKQDGEKWNEKKKNKRHIKNRNDLYKKKSWNVSWLNSLKVSLLYHFPIRGS